MVQLYSFSCGYPVFPAPFVEETILYPLCSHGTHVENHLSVYHRVYFWPVYFVTLVYMSVFMWVPYCFDYCSYVKWFWNRDVWSLQLCFSFSRVSWLFQFLWESIWIFRIVFFYICKNRHWDFDRDCFESIDHLGHTDILTILSLPIHEHGVSSHYLYCLYFLSAIFYSFQYIHFLPPWLSLFLSILLLLMLL